MSSYVQYDVLGNEVKLIDGRGKATIKSFSDCFGAPNGNATSCTTPSELTGLSSFALVTSTTNAVSQTSYTQYDYYTALPVDVQDVNGSVTSSYYDDSLDRPTKVVGPANYQAFFTYDASNKKITTEVDQASASDKNLKTVVKYDGLGRTWRSGKYNGSTWELVDVTFDENGNVSTRTNPFTNSSPDSGSSGTVTTSTYDGMGRLLTVTTPDSAAASRSYSGNVVTATDQAGKKRKHKTDALGRLVEVVEDPDTLNYSTTIYQTVFNKPYKVIQGSQTRYWLYDSLGRVVADRKPEQSAPHSITDSLSGNNSWSNRYIYDANSNLTYIYDAREKEKGWSYDDIDRITAIGYPNSNTPGSAFTWDSATNGTGRLASVETYNVIGGTNAYSKLTINTYDAAGRITKQTQSFLHGGVYKDYVVEQSYNRAGQVTQVKYPSTRTADYSWNVAGRLSSMSGNLGGTSKTYISSATYNAAGQRLTEAWGTTTALYLNKHYNNRLQMYDIRLGTSSTNDWEWNRGALRYYYASNYAWGDGGTNNNGNLYRGEHFVPIDAGVTEWMISTDYYSYDALNRLSETTEIKEEYLGGNYTSSQVFKQVNVYDRYGNRTIDQTNSSGSINMANFEVNAATNRLQVPSGLSGTITYDAAGNLVFDSLLAGGGSSNRVYDNNQRLEKTYDTGSEIIHVFDHADRRVRRRWSNDNQTWYVYGIQGELLAYYDKNSTTPLKEYAYKDGAVFIIGEGSTMKWCVTDHLGSIRMIVASDGSLSGIERHDYAPFGEELLAGVGARTTGRGYLAGASGGLTFTGQERDVDTGLDYFRARFHHNIPGRFTSVDPAEGSLDLGNPQSFNRFSYVLNSPMVFVDPTGRWPERSNTISRQSLGTILNPATITESPVVNFETIRRDNHPLSDQHIATDKAGFVDLRHFAVAASVAMIGKSPLVPNFAPFFIANLLGVVKEAHQGVGAVADTGLGILINGGSLTNPVGLREGLVNGVLAGDRATLVGLGLFSSAEFPFGVKTSGVDTRSNFLGAYFGAYVYDPRKGPVADQMIEFLKSLGILDPESIDESAFGFNADFISQSARRPKKEDRQKTQRNKQR